MRMEDSVAVLKGVGPKLTTQLEGMGLYTLKDLLLYFPRGYDTFLETDHTLLNSMEKLRLVATVTKVQKPFRTRSGKTLTTILFSTEFGPLKAMFFNMPYVGHQYVVGESYTLTGKFLKKGKNIESINPVQSKDVEEIVPIYSLSGKVTGTLLKKLLRQILSMVVLNENLPKDLLDKEELLGLDDAVRNLHFPEDPEVLEKALKRMKFQEMFSYALKILLAKNRRLEEEEGIVFSMSPRLKTLKETLPFALTKAQNRVMREILLDQKKSTPMNRLLQGDVGSGKTIIAFIALFNVVDNGYQGAFMAPTEILAKQHYEEAQKLLEKFHMEVRLLTGSTKKKEREVLYKELSEGKPMLVIGTHALIEEKVHFKNLGMIITDEQHRFGVHQRAKLIRKSKQSEVLVMSATPIPRTMALTIYSDLDVSVIDELPKGRKEIKTMLLSENQRKSAYEKVLAEVQGGRQAYVVTPLIEFDEESELNSVLGLYETLSKGVLKGIPMAYLHGKMSSKEKDEIMEAFKKGDLKVLVSTTVIEVGVNVQNASVMIIENAERFGLAQLHQLRGRVGRGPYQSYCLLVAKIGQETTRQRLEVMVKSNDGFYIAEEDLKNRGTGQLFGLHQSGHSGLLLSDLSKDYDLFVRANIFARAVYHSEEETNKAIKESFLENLSESLHYICLN